MKKIVMLLFGIAIGQTAFADCFLYTYQGKTLVYDIEYGSAHVSRAAAVVNGYYCINTAVSGDVVIPSYVIRNDTTYLVTSIDEFAFYGNSGLTSVIIGNSVTSIGERAFQNCSSLASVTIGHSVTEIGDYAFLGCSGLTTVAFNATNCIFAGARFPAFTNCTNITNFTFGNNVTRIPNDLCYYITGLTSVTIPNSVTRIGESAFEHCTGLTSVTIPNSVSHIGNDAFKGCSGLASVTFNADSCILAGAYNHRVFHDCSNITNFIFGGNVKVIPANLCNSLVGLTSVNIPDSVVSIGKLAFAACSGLISATIGNSVTFIDTGAFQYCSSLTSITIPNSTTFIGARAFSNCSSLTSITIPNSTTFIGARAFSNCSSLTSLTIGNAVSSIGVNAFANCNGLTSVTFNADSCTTLCYNNGDWVFLNCTNVTNFTFGNNVRVIPDNLCRNLSGLTSLNIPNSVTSIGKNAFSGCRGLTSATIGNSVTSIDIGAFQYCSGLSSITIPNSTTFIGAYAFSNCSSLTSLTIGNAVTSIGNFAFQSCSSLDTIIMLPVIAPVAGSNCFYNNSTSRKFYIPCGSYNSYYNGNGWPNYRYYLREPEPDYSITVGVNNTAYGSVTNTPVTCAERTIISATANNHYHFEHWSNGSTANPDTIVLTSDSSVTAFFIPNQYTVTGVSSDNNKGSVSGTATVDYLSTVSLTATANNGFHFVQWQDGNTQNPRTITVTGDATYTAYFEAIAPTQYTITATSANPTMGTVSGGGSYASGVTATLTATANTGYHFTQWQDGNTQNPRTITVMGNATYTAYFDANAPVNPATVTATISEIESTSAHADIAMGQHTSYFYYFYGPQSAFTQNGLTTDEAIISYVNQNYGASERNYSNVSGYMNGLTPSTDYLLVVVPYNSNNEVGTVCREQFTTLSSAGTATVTATISGIESTSAHADIVMGQNTSYFYYFYGPQSAITQNGLTTDEAIISYVNQNYGASERNYSNVSGYMNGLIPNTAYLLVVVPYNSNDEVGTITRKQFTTLNTNGIEDASEETVAIGCKDGRLTVGGAEGEMVSVYSIDGRRVCSLRATETTVIDVPTAGVYLVKVGDTHARKVVVIR